MNSNYFWWIEGLLGVLALIALQYGIKLILSQAGKKQGQEWRLKAGRIFQTPLTVLIWTLVILYLIDVAGKHLGFSITLSYLDAFRKTVVVAAFAWIFFRWKGELEHSLLSDSKRKVDSTTVSIVGRLMTIVIVIITALVVMQIFGVNTAPLLAFGGIGAASIGFAGKDVIANFCSGILLQITRPFVRGDHILLPEKNLEGHIEEIGWFKTSVRDIEKRAVYLPNNFFSTMIVVNISRISHRHLKKTLEISFDDVEKISKAVQAMRQELTSNPHIDKNYPIHVFLKSFDDHACEVEIEAFSTLTDVEKFNKYQQEILLKIEEILKSMEISLSHPTILMKQIS